MVTAADIERAIRVLEAYQRGEIDESISDDLYDRLASAIGAAYEQEIASDEVICDLDLRDLFDDPPMVASA